MIRFSNKCHYALLAVVELARHHGDGLLTIAEIAARQGIPMRFLQAILRELKRGGIADSVRGNSGGYFLKKNPKEISVAQVVTLLNSTRLLDAEPTNNSTPSSTIIEELYGQAHSAFLSTLAETSLADLLLREENIEAVPNYCI